MNLKKILALVLVFAMCLSMVPTYAFAEDEGIELVEEEPEAIVEVVDEPEEEPSTEPEEEETPQEPVEEEVPEEPAPTEEEPEEEPEEEEEEEELVLASEGVKDDESFEANRPNFLLYHPGVETPDEFTTMQEALNEAQNNDTLVLATDTDAPEDASEPPFVVNKKITIDGAGLYKIRRPLYIGITPEKTLIDGVAQVEIRDVTLESGVVVAGGTYDDPVQFTRVTFGVDSTLQAVGAADGSATIELTYVVLNGVDMKYTGNSVTIKSTDPTATSSYGVTVEIIGGVFAGAMVPQEGAGNSTFYIWGGSFARPILKKWIRFGYDTETYSGDYLNKDHCTGTVQPTQAEAAVWRTDLSSLTKPTGDGGWHYFNDLNDALAYGFGPADPDTTLDGIVRVARPIAFTATPTSISYEMPTRTNLSDGEGGFKPGFLRFYPINLPAKMSDLVIPSKGHADGYHVALDSLDPINYPGGVNRQLSPAFDCYFEYATYPYFAMIGDDGYDSLKAAYATYQDGETIVLFANPVATDTIVLENNASVKIKTNGHTVVVDDGNNTETANIKAKNTAYAITVTKGEDGVNTYTASPVTFELTHTPAVGEPVTVKYASFEDALAEATATDIIKPIANTGAKITKEVTINKNVILDGTGAALIITAPVTIDAEVKIVGSTTMSGNAGFTIAEGGKLIAGENNQDAFTVTGVNNFANLLASNSNLVIGGAVVLRGLKDSAILAADGAMITVIGTVNASDIPATVPVFQGGQYVIEAVTTATNVIACGGAGSFGFVDTDVTINKGTVHVKGFKDCTVTVNAADARVILPAAGKVFDLSEEDYVKLTKVNPEDIQNGGAWWSALNRPGTGLVAYTAELVTEPTPSTVNMTFYPAFKTAAKYTVSETLDRKNVIGVLDVPAADDVYQFTDPAHQLVVEIESGINVTPTNLAVAYSDDAHPEQLYYYVKAELGEDPFDDCTVLSQARAVAIVCDKASNTYVKGYGSFAEAATPMNYKPETQFIFVKDPDDSIATLTNLLPEVFVMLDDGATVKKPVPADDLEGWRVEQEVVGDYTRFFLIDEHVNVTWNAGEKGYWFDNGVPMEDDEGNVVRTITATATKLATLTSIIPDPLNEDASKAFVGWIDDPSKTEPIDFDTYKLPETPVTFYALYGDAKVQLRDSGEYVYSFSTIEAAYEFKRDNPELNKFLDEFPTVIGDVEVQLDADIFATTTDVRSIPYNPVVVINNGAEITATIKQHQNPDEQTATFDDISKFWTVTCTDLSKPNQTYSIDYKYNAVKASSTMTATRKQDGTWTSWTLSKPTKYSFFTTLAEAVENSVTEPETKLGNKKTWIVNEVLVARYCEETYTMQDALLQGTKPVSERVLFGSSFGEENPIIPAIGSTWTYSKSEDTEYSGFNTRVFWLPTVTVTFATANTQRATETEVIEKLAPVESSMSIASPTELPEVTGHTFQYFCTDTNAPETSKVVFVDGQYTVYATEINETTGRPTDTNLTIYAYYTPNQYTVTLAYFDEVKQAIATSTTITGHYKDDVDITTVTDLLLPEGRKLDIWATPSNLDVEAATPTELTEDATFYALIKPQITFVGIADGVATGTALPPITQSRGTPLDAEAISNAENHVFDDTGRVFDYWSLASRTDAEKIATPTEMPNADTTYYAIAKPVITITVASWIDDHVATSTSVSGNRDDHALIKYDDQAVSLFDGTGRVFDYWSLSTGTDKAPVTPSDIYETDVTYYAIAKPWVTITLSSWIDDAVATSTDFSGNRDEDVQFKYEEQAVSLFDGTDRVFDYWSLSTGTDKAPVTPTDTYETDVTYYAIAKPRITITLQAVVNKELASSTTLVENRDEEKDVSDAFEKSEKDLFTDGRVFDYWATGTDVSNLTKVPTPTVLKFEEDVTYYAVAKPVITVTLSSWIGGKVATSTSWSENRDETAAGAAVEEFFMNAETALFDGTERKFHHWATSTDVDAKAIERPTELTFDEDQTYYAIPAPVFTLTLKYGENIQEIVGDADYDVDKAKVASATNALFAGTGDKFAGTWTDLYGTPTSLPEKYTADLTFVAVAYPKVEVTFDAGSGVFKDPVTEKNTNTSTATTNSTDPVDANYQKLWSASKPSRANYVFNGWLDENSNPVLATQTFLTSATLTADWVGRDVTVTFTDTVSKWTYNKIVPYGDELVPVGFDIVQAHVSTRAGHAYYEDDLWNEELVTPVTGEATYTLKWFDLLSSVPCIVAEPDKQTQVYEFEDIPINRELKKPDELNNVKQGGKTANWLINGDTERYFEFSKDLVPEDLEFFLATFTDAPIPPEPPKPTPTDLFTVTWATDAGAKILEIDEDVLYGSKPEFNGVVPTMTNTKDKFYYFDGWTIFGDPDEEVYTEDELPEVTEDFEFHAHFTAVDHKESGVRSLSLGDSIAIKWRLNPDSIDSHADMSLYRAEYTFTNAEGVEAAGTITGDSLIVASPIAYCAAKEMTLPVTVTLFYDDVEIAEFEYTVRDYCLDGLKRTTLDPKWLNLFAATLDYGAWAQTFKNFKTDDLANAGVTHQYDVKKVPDATVTKSTGVTFNLITEAETLLQVKFATGGKDISDFTFKVGTKDVTDTVFVENNKFVVNIGGIPARQLDQSVTVTMTPKADGEILRFLGSPVGYMKTAFDKGSAPLPDFMKAMYNYHYYAQQAQGAN